MMESGEEVGSAFHFTIEVEEGTLPNGEVPVPLTGLVDASSSSLPGGLPTQGDNLRSSGTVRSDRWVISFQMGRYYPVLRGNLLSYVVQICAYIRHRLEI